MTVPVTGEVFETPEVVDRLARFLRELTDDGSGREVYSSIAEEIERPDHDERMDGLIDDPAVFEATWTAVTHGLRPPPAAWESVVLPAVVAFSTPANVKNHLELAASLWVAAETAVEVPAATSTVYGRPAVEPQPIAEPRPALPPVAVPSGSRARRRVLLVILLVVIIIAVVAAVWQLVGTPVAQLSTLDKSSVAPSTTTPGLAPSPVVSSSSALPPVVSHRPAPTPTWTGPAPAIAPGAPTGLAVIKVTTASIAFDWQPPADAGSGGLSHYRIFVDGQDVGWTSQTKTTVGGLTPTTTYSITVESVNGAGLTSPLSSPLSATTDAPAQSTAPPTLSVSITPVEPIPLGDSFTVTGTGWLCAAPGDVTIWLNSALVAQRNTGAQGDFNAPINVHMDTTDSTYYVDVLGGSQRVTVVSGPNPLTVQCGADLSQSLSVTFT